jgi:hypothetical protein
MRIEEKFNKRTAELIEVQPPSFHAGPNFSALGIKATFFQLPGSDDTRTLSVHMTPDEALLLAENLIAAARRARR